MYMLCQIGKFIELTYSELSIGSIFCSSLGELDCAFACFG